MSHFWSDLRFAWRTLRTKPVFAAVAVLSLALGIGANTAIFSVIESSLLRGLPYKNADQLVQVNVSAPQWDGAVSISPPEWLDYKRQAATLAGLAAFTKESLTLRGVNEAYKLDGMSVTTNFFDVLGATAERGRLMSPRIDKPGADTRVAVLSDATWRSVFGADPNIVGRDVTMNGSSFRIIGVLSPKQDYPSGFQVWISPRIDIPERREFGDPNQYMNSYGEMYLTGLARVKQGVSIEQAQEEATVIAKNIAPQHVQTKNTSLLLQPLQDTMVKRIRPALWILLTAVVLLLLIACANLSGLLLARTTGRTREFAVRLALGATRREIMRLSLSESVLLAIGGGLCGILIAVAGIKVIAHYGTFGLPAALMPELNMGVLAFCLAATVASALLSGLIPALNSSQTDVNAGLKESSRGTASQHAHRLRSLLTGGEIAVSVMLLIGASLLLRSFAKLISTDPGFNPSHAVTARLSLPDSQYGTDARINAFWKQLLPKLSGVPGVRSVGLLSNLPLSGSNNSSLIRIEGHRYASKADGFAVNEFAVSPDTFKALQVPLLEGRTMSERDTASAPFVAVISKRFADVAFPHQDPIGRRYNGAHIPGWITIVGVVGNIAFHQLGEAPELDAYYSYQQDAVNSSGLILRGDPSLGDLRRTVHNLDANIPLTNVRPLGEYLARSLATRKFLLGLLTAFSGLAILLAATGLYAVLAYSVQQRKQEIGIRIALGATSSNVLWLILRECLTIATIGTAVGLLGATWTTSFLKSMLYGVTTTDLTAYIAAVALILTVAIAASLAPAIHATRIDPVSALRYE